MLRPYLIAANLHNLDNLQNLPAQYPEFCVSRGLASICVCGIGIRT
jgi:hypothetical protein